MIGKRQLIPAIPTFDGNSIAKETAKVFIDVGAVHIYSDHPFIFTSGWASPVYIDCRRLISFPEQRQKIIDYCVSVISHEIGLKNFDVIVGAETAGIPFAAWLSDKFKLPMQYVRKEPKGFARNAWIEGSLEENQNALLVDDLATDGRSKIKFCNTLREAGAKVEHAFSLFFYDIFPETLDNLAENNLQLHSLATWAHVLEVSKILSKFDTSTLDEVEEFLHDPVSWSKANGGIGEERRIAQPYSSRPIKC